MYNRLNSGVSPKHRSRWLVLLIALLIALLILLIWYLYQRSASRGEKPTAASSFEEERDTMPDAPIPGDTPVAPDTSTRIEPPRKKPQMQIQPPPDTAAADTAMGADTLGASDTVDTTTLMTSPCAIDTIEPWVYPDPSGGLHRGAARVFLRSTEPCSISWRFDGASEWRTYRDEEIVIEKSKALLFTATDSCGNTMATRREVYEIQARGESGCPDDMEPVKVGSASFCIDRHEWPNKRGEKPRAYISLFHAMDSCYSIGKRLCTSEEWTMACTGPYGWRYPYGQAYETYACATHDTVVPRSGSKPECRGYFGVYDMSGSLMEWTATRSTVNRDFYNVMGGFWDSGPQSSCRDVRYSYYPQNRHNPVGFRCCKDTELPKGAAGPE